MFSFSSFALSSGKWGRIVGTSVIFGKVKSINLDAREITAIEPSGKTMEWELPLNAKLIGTRYLHKIKADDYIVVKVSKSVEGKTKVLSLELLKEKPRVFSQSQ